MYHIEYFKRRNSHTPFLDWLEGSDVDPKTHAQLMAKIAKLESEGPKLFETTMLKRLSGTELCELINGDYRILVYFEHFANTFWLLNGFRKTKQNQKEKVVLGKNLLDELKGIRRL